MLGEPARYIWGLPGRGHHGIGATLNDFLLFGQKKPRKFPPSNAQRLIRAMPFTAIGRVLTCIDAVPLICSLVEGPNANSVATTPVPAIIASYLDWVGLKSFSRAGGPECEEKYQTAMARIRCSGSVRAASAHRKTTASMSDA